VRDTALIVLASGTSSRFTGGNKLLADLNGKPVLQHVINMSAQISFAKTYAVISDGRVRALLEPVGFNCVQNFEPENGQGSALALSVQAVLEGGYSKAVIMLGDMPFVSAAHIEALMQTDGDVIMSECEGKRLPPSVFRGEAFKALATHSGELGGKSTINLANVATIALSQSAARDIDTREDLDTAS